MRRALVTGAGHGIGAAIALALAQDGCDVVVHYRQSAGTVVSRIEALGRKAVAVQADLLSPGEADRLVQESVAFLGGIDVLVCNAGHLVGRVTVADMSDEHYAKVMDVNVGTTFRTVRAAIPHLKQGARVITMSSLAAHNGGGAGASAYATAKGGVMSFTRAMAKELGPRGIRVNALCCGMIATSFHDTFTKPEVRKNVAAATPLRREGTAAEAADAAVFLASSDAAFVNGACLDVNGGLAFS